MSLRLFPYLYIICLTLLGTTGCATSSKTNNVIDTPKPTPINVPDTNNQLTGRTDLPTNWFEVKGTNWSYGLPIVFDAAKNYGKDILVQHVSVTYLLTVNFATHSNEYELLEDFVFQKFIPLSQSLGKQILAVRSKDDILAVHSIYPSENILHSPNMFDGALDFFIQRGKTIYHLSCFGEAGQLKSHSQICFQIIDTLKIN